MKVPQVAGSIWRYEGSGDSVTFGRQVPRGLTVELNPGASEAVEVRPGTSIVGRFTSLEVIFPSVVAAQDLDIHISGRDGIWQLVDAALPQAWRVSSGSVNISPTTTTEIILPPVADVTGSVDALELYGAVQVSATTNLPNYYLYWTSPVGDLLQRWNRFAAVSLLGIGYFKITGWDYPLMGGKLSIVNGSTARTLKHDLFAVRK